MVFLRAKLAEPIEPAAVGQHKIEQDQVRGLGERRSSFPDRSRGNDLIALFLQPALQVAAESLFVFDDEDASHVVNQWLAWVCSG